MALEFTDPPSRGNARWGDDDFDEARRELIERTCQWALLKTYRTQGAAGMTAHRAKSSSDGWRGHHWEATTRKTDTGETAIYVRHIAKEA